MLLKKNSLTIHVPAICLSEGRNVIRKKFQPRYQLAPIRKYVRWAKDQAKLDQAAAEAVRKTLEQYEQFIGRRTGQFGHHCLQSDKDSWCPGFLII
jgi:histone H3/H4